MSIMDTNGFMPPTYFHRIGAQMRQETDIPNVPVCAAAGKIYGLGAGLEAPVMHQFIFEQSPEAFHGGVVVAVPPARHRWHHAELIEQFSVLMGAILKDWSCVTYSDTSIGGNPSSEEY